MKKIKHALLLSAGLFVCTDVDAAGGDTILSRIVILEDKVGRLEGHIGVHEAASVAPAVSDAGANTLQTATATPPAAPPARVRILEGHIGVHEPASVARAVSDASANALQTAAAALPTATPAIETPQSHALKELLAKASFDRIDQALVKADGLLALEHEENFGLNTAMVAVHNYVFYIVKGELYYKTTSSTTKLGLLKAGSSNQTSAEKSFTLASSNGAEIKVTYYPASSLAESGTAKVQYFENNSHQSSGPLVLK